MFVIALVLLGSTLAYFLVTTTVDLFPFNNAREATHADRRTEVAINTPILAAPMILVILAAALHLPVLAYAGGAVELLVAAGGVVLWWLPYLAGITVPWATAGTNQCWSELHARIYARTIIVLPPIRDRPRPNLEHMVLHALLITGGTAAILAGINI